jgi:two-component system sensor histidine kinase RegB
MVNRLAFRTSGAGSPTLRATAQGDRSTLPKTRFIDALISRATLLFDGLKIPKSESNDTTPQFLWLIRLRWWAILFGLCMAPPCISVGILDRSNIGAFMGVLGVLTVFNLIFSHVATSSQERLNPVWIAVQFSIDLTMTTTVLSFTGGFSSPFIGLLVLTSGLAGVLVPTPYQWHYLLLAQAQTLYLSIEYLQQNSLYLLPRDAVELLALHAIVIIGWLVMRSLGRHLESQKIWQLEHRARRERLDRLRALGALTSGFSHEFASPLNTAKIRIERALRGRRDEDLLEAQLAIQNCERVMRQMNSAQFDTEVGNHRQVQLRELVTEIADSWRLTQGESQPRIDVKVDSTAQDLRTRLPLVNFTQVLLNLLDNAKEASPLGRIEIRLATFQGEVQVSVLDQGDGFVREVAQRIGEPFVTSKMQGTGLGLYVASLFCLSMSGRLQINRCEDNSRTQVTLTWPIQAELDHE